MSRRRYISTDISKDERVNQLAIEYGDFAALFYTWMIPHATDKAVLHGTPGEILAEVAPWRKDKTSDDVVEILGGTSAVGLIAWDTSTNTVYFPIDTFYKYQPYIKPKNRRTWDWPAGSEKQQNKNLSLENLASLSPSPSHSHSLSPPHSKRDDVSSPPIELSEASTEERAIMQELQSVKGYPFDYTKDLTYLRKLKVEFSTLDVHAVIRKWCIAKLDNPLLLKQRPRMQLHTWCGNQARWNMEKAGPTIPITHQVTQSDTRRLMERAEDIT